MKQNTKEWIEWRKTKIGASDAPVIMDVSPWKTPHKLWMEKIGMDDVDVKNPSMIRGTEMEEIARNEFISMTGISVFPSIVTSIEHEWMIASLDGVSFDSQYAVEIKCPGKLDHACAKSGIIPEKYYPQLQHQICVLGLDDIFYFSYDGHEGIILKVERNQEYIDKLIVKELKFYECIMNLIPPEMNEKDFINKNDEEWNSICKEYKIISTQLDELLLKQNILKEKLISMAEGKNCLGPGIKLQKVIKKGSISYCDIPQISNLDLEKYRKSPIDYWKISEIKN